jgi:predicted anti-sigma-YlaC factor YlaD
MQCSTYREALSARLDGEPLGIPARALDDHLAACPACAAWAAEAADLTARIRRAPAPAAPDLTAAVLATLPPDLAGAGEHRGRLVTTGLRLALLVAGVAQAVLAWPTLAFGGGSMAAPVHMTHETGAWNLAVAAAFVAVAALPRLAAGALPFLGTFTALLVPLTTGDLIAGRVPPERAVGHLLLIAGVVLVAVMAWRGRRRPTVTAVARGRVVA